MRRSLKKGRQTHKDGEKQVCRIKNKRSMLQTETEKRRETDTSEQCQRNINTERHRYRRTQVQRDTGTEGHRDRGTKEKLQGSTSQLPLTKIPIETRKLKSKQIKHFNKNIKVKNKIPN